MCQAGGENPGGGQGRCSALGKRLRKFSLFNRLEHLLDRFLRADLAPIDKAFDADGKRYHGTQKQGDHDNAPFDDNGDNVGHGYCRSPFLF